MVQTMALMLQIVWYDPNSMFFLRLSAHGELWNESTMSGMTTTKILRYRMAIQCFIINASTINVTSSVKKQCANTALTWRLLNHGNIIIHRMTKCGLETSAAIWKQMPGWFLSKHSYKS